MLREAFRAGVATARAAGWRAFGLALLAYVPIAVLGSVAGGAFLFAGLWLHIVVVLALVRVLAAARPEPVPPVPQVDDQGHRVLAPPRPGPPLTAADRNPTTALRQAARLWRPALSITGLYLLAGIFAALTAVALSGGRFAEYSPTAQLVAVLPLSALATAFVALAPQRVAIEGDPRVLVAAAHSVRIARSAYGALLLLTVAEPLVAVGALLALPEKNPALGKVIAVAVVTVLVDAVVKVVATAVENELYLRGPRLDLPVP